MSSESRVYRTLFLCTGNSARSIMAEALLNKLGNGRFVAFSAGSQPTGIVNPTAIEVLRRFDFPIAGLESKSWERFSGPQAPTIDFVFTVCDRAAAESCPTWPGQPMHAHWGIADPAACAGDELERLQAFRQAFAELERRISLFVALPLNALDTLALQSELDAIGRDGDSS